MAICPSYLVPELVIFPNHLSASTDIFLAPEVLKRGNSQGEKTLSDCRGLVEIASPPSEGMVALMNEALRFVPLMLELALPHLLEQGNGGRANIWGSRLSSGNDGPPGIVYSLGTCRELKS